MPFRSRGRLYIYAFAEVLVLLLLAYLYLLGFTWGNLLRCAIYLAVIGFFAYASGQLAKFEEPQEPSFARPFMRFVDTGYFPIAAALLIALFAAYWTGIADARDQERFMVSKTKPSTVVLKQYGSRLVAAHLIGPRTVDKSSVVLIQLGGSVAREFVWRDVGPLHLRDD